MNTIEAKGKSVDEAILSGLEQMGLGLDQVEIEVVKEGGKGLFGISKTAVVRLNKKAETDEEVLRQTRGRAEKDRPAKSGAAPEKAAEKAPERRSGMARSDKAKPAQNPETGAEPGSGPTPKTPDDGEDAKQAVEFLTNVFEKMGVSATATASQGAENRLLIDISGEDTAAVIGRRGETLDALQYLTGLVVNKNRKGDYRKTLLDAENYRARREQTLIKLAKRRAAEAVKSGKTVALEPMTAYERRILHAALQNDDRVETGSEGEEPYRRVIIRRKRRGRKSADQ